MFLSQNQQHKISIQKYTYEMFLVYMSSQEPENSEYSWILFKINFPNLLSLNMHS